MAPPRRLHTASEICHGLSEWRCCGRKCVLRSPRCCDRRSGILTKVTRSFAQPASFLRQTTHFNRRCTTQEHEVSVRGQHDVLCVVCCRAFTALPKSLTSPRRPRHHQSHASRSKLPLLSIEQQRPEDGDSKGVQLMFFSQRANQRCGSMFWIQPFLEDTTL